MRPTDEVVLNSVRQWFEKAVLGLNLCPFAVRPYKDGAIVFELTYANDDESCLTDVFLNLQKMDQDDSIETLLLICPHHLSKFSDYNQFLALADQLLEQEGWVGIYQIASFHPDYHFAYTSVDDRSNWTNRSPYPLLHLIREESVSQAIASAKNIHQVSINNIATLNKLDDTAMQEIFGSRFVPRNRQGKKIPE